MRRRARVLRGNGTRFAALLVLALLGAGFRIVSGAAANAPAKPGSASEAAANPRQPDADLILLRDGSQLTGTLLNEVVTLTTAYGRLQLETRFLADADLDLGERGVDWIVAANRNRFSGFVEDSMFKLRLPDSNQIELRREKVAKVVFGIRPVKIPELPASRSIRLRNGDLLNGQLLIDSLPLDAGGGRRSVPLDEVVSFEINSGKVATIRIRLRNNEVLEGVSEIEAIRVKLDVGPTIELHRDRITAIHERSAGMRGEFTSAPLQDFVQTFEAGSGGMVWIAPGEFVMGSPADELGRDQDEGPQTTVKITRGFWMGKCEVTQAEFQRLMEVNPSNFAGDPARPVEKVSWFEAMEYCAKLTKQAHAAGLPETHLFRLPTEAEWEYACRAGTATRYSFGDDKSYLYLGRYAWFTSNSDSTTRPVGTRLANPWGLFDMHGNVWEWCLDRWQGFLPGGAITNRPIVAEGALRVARGGSWLYEAKICRSANRDDYGPSNRCSDVGFRVILAPVEP